MRTRHSIFLILVCLILASCNRHESITGGYGDVVVSGRVVLSGDVPNTNPAGMVVSVSETGMATTLATDGGFAFAGVPRDPELTFTRADGINAHLRVTAASSTSLVIEVSNATAKTVTSSPHPEEQYEGIVKSVTADSIVMLDSHGNTVTIAIDGTTLIRKGNTTVLATDLKENDRIHVQAVMKGSTLTATQVIVQQTENDGGDDGDNDGQTMTANGLVKSVDGSDLVVESQPKGDVTVKTDGSTIIRKQGQIIAVSDIKPGWEVNCMGKKIDEHSLQARQIEVRGNSN